MVARDEHCECRRDRHGGDEADAADESGDDLHRDDLAVGDGAEALGGEREEHEERERGSCVGEGEGVDRGRDVVPTDPEPRAVESGGSSSGCLSEVHPLRTLG